MVFKRYQIYLIIIALLFMEYYYVIVYYKHSFITVL